jgi:hypothetical protein
MTVASLFTGPWPGLVWHKGISCSGNRHAIVIRGHSCFSSKACLELAHAPGTPKVPSEPVGSGTHRWYQLTRQAFKLFNKYAGFC